MSYPPAARKLLRPVIANLYPTASDARIVVSDVELNPAKIAFTDKSDLTWFNILDHADRRDKVHEIINRALQDFPENEQLKSAREQAPLPLIEGPQSGKWNGPADTGHLEKIIG